MAVIGIDASEEMTRQLARRAAIEGLPVQAVTADAAAFTVDGPVPVVFAVFNTFFLLADTEIQCQFLHRAREALSPGGRLVVETFVPRPGRLPDGPHPGVFPADSTVVVKQQHTDRLVLFAATNSPSAQTLAYHEVVLTDGQPARLYPGSMRYCWPADLDAMTAGAGLRLADRWDGWDRRDYDPATSRKHVSFYAAEG